ncbi:MAG: ABC transporter permease, partial [Pseudanabaena sp. M114S2SP2A07QC]|nr:ABC transporter permease [Pseudanabaena sp. M114S2SP2A07QC]
MNIRDRWRSTSENFLLPIGALLASLVVFGIFCAVQGKNPIAIYGTIYSSAFGSSFSWQGTLIRSAPLMLTSLCTALPAMLGLTIIGNEGALIVGGLG